MVELLEGFLDVSFHRGSQSPCLLVPVQVNPNVLVSFPVTFDGVVGLQGLFQVFGIFQVHILDSKVINNKGEGDWCGFLFE